jgi:gluconolactonase
MPAPEPFAQGLTAPGGLAFDSDDVLFVTDTRNGRIAKVTPEARILPFVSTGGRPTDIAFDDSNDLFVAEKGRRILLIVSLDEAEKVYAHQSKGRRFHGPHALCFSPDGSILFSDPGDSTADRPTGGIYAVDLNGEAEQVAGGLAGPTGVVISEDAGYLFVAESARNRIVSMAIGDRGALSGQEVFVEFNDGRGVNSLRFDAEGVLYATRPGVGLSLVDPDGKVIQNIPLPGGEPTGMVFGGIDFDQLYVAEATSGTVYRMRAAHPGQRPFAGPRSV